ncbi:MAG: glycosyltransferase 2 family protein [Chloroflexota bacterium]|nr:glycosyltransferase 2 family protein [Chloroflexota bacterium]
MRKKILDVLKWVWFVAVIIGAGYYFYRNYQKISVYLETISAWRVVLSFLLLFLGKFALSDLTRFSLRKINEKLEYKDALTITSITQLGKYLPGGIWHVAGKFGIYKARKISTKKATAAVVLENVWLLSSALVIGAVCLLLTSPDVLCEFNGIFCNAGVNRAILIGLPVLWIAALLLIDYFGFKENRYSVQEFLLLMLEVLVIWVSFGISFWLVFPLQSGFQMAITGAFSISWVAGYVAFFAPGGIGIREYLLTVILAAYFSSSEVATYATIHRLIWVVVEILLGAGSSLLFGIPIADEKTESLDVEN